MNTAAFIALLLTALRSVAHGHMFVSKPASRNFFANQDGEDFAGVIGGIPRREYTPQGLNGNTKVCGREGGSGINYDTWNDSQGNPMPWISQSKKGIGDNIQIDIMITAHHLGHFEVKACDMGKESTQECFDSNPLTFIEDVSFGMPKDDNHPERAMLFGDGVDISYVMKLPDNIVGDEVLLQFIYWTANTCNYEGYKEYFTNNDTPPSNKGNWSPGLGDCPKILPTLRGGEAITPEIFVNCAEITIQGAPTVPSPTPAPAPTPTPVNQDPVEAPVTTGKLPPVDPNIVGTCGQGLIGNGICPAQTLCCSKFGYCGNVATRHCDTDPRFINGEEEEEEEEEPISTCVDSEDVVFKNKKGKKKKCNWVGKGSSKKIKKKCNKKWKGEKLKFSCPVACGICE